VTRTVVHHEPQGPQDTGKNASLGRFGSGYPDTVLSATTLRYPGGPVYETGRKCGSRPAVVQVKAGPRPEVAAGRRVSNPGRLRIARSQEITLAFLPRGSSVPQPPAARITPLLRTTARRAQKTPTSHPSATAPNPVP